MESKKLFQELGYELTEDSIVEIVFVKYFGDSSLPKYKRSCLKIIFYHSRKSFMVKGRNEKGNQASHEIDTDTLRAICQITKELGWIDHDN